MSPPDREDGIARGPFDADLWPATLEANVVTSAPRPRVHGYDVEDDVARHYRFSDLLLLALSGEIPDAPAGRAFEIALFFLAPSTVAEAPAHAAGLARLCGGSVSTTLATGALALAEQARCFTADHADLIRWLDGGEAEPPAPFRAQDDEDCASVARLRGLVEEAGMIVRGLDAGLSRSAALLAVLHACGVKTPAHIETVLVVARTACVAAEALAVKPGDLRRYPVNLPAFRYQGTR